MSTTNTTESFVIRREVRDDYPAIGPAVLERVDSRLAAPGYVHRYAPVADTPSGVDLSAAFWDTWGEVVALAESREEDRP